MAGRRSVLNAELLGAGVSNNNGNADPLRELFEACKVGDLARVKKLVTPKTVNARDTAGRKSTPLHFAAGRHYFQCILSRAFFPYITLFLSLFKIKFTN
jgi:tankyrase